MRTWIAALLIGACASLFGSADTLAQLLTPAINDTGGAAPACSNSLDFSKACNSEYINVVGI